VEDWRACLHRGPAIAQQILRKLFPIPDLSAFDDLGRSRPPATV
jgi:hypothetical protein